MVGRKEGFIIIVTALSLVGFIAVAPDLGIIIAAFASFIYLASREPKD